MLSFGSREVSDAAHSVWVPVFTGTTLHRSWYRFAFNEVAREHLR